MADDGVDLNELAAFPEEEEETKPQQKVAVAKKAYVFPMATIKLTFH